MCMYKIVAFYSVVTVAITIKTKPSYYTFINNHLMQ